MRIAVADVLEWLAAGQTYDQILGDFPELTEDDIRACLAYAATQSNLVARWRSVGCEASVSEVPSRQLIIPLADPVQAERKPDPLFRRLENDERRGLGGTQLPEQLVVHHDFGDAAVG
jgi:hypothetical protein